MSGCGAAPSRRFEQGRGAVGPGPVPPSGSVRCMGMTARAAPASSRERLAVGVFEDEVRAEQAARALEVWRAANRRLGVGPIAVVARRGSGGTTWRARGVSRPGHSALVGLAIGLVLFALPTAGAAALAAWVVGTAVFGLAGLVGAVPADHDGLVLALVLGSSVLAGLLTGLVGALLGCLVGLAAGLVDREVRGLRRSEVALTASALRPGGWSAVLRVPPPVEPLARGELVRLGGTPAVLGDAPDPRSAVPAPPEKPVEAGSPRA
jgi:hypothetical protein